MHVTTVECDACTETHVEEVEFVEEPPGSTLRAYIPCPDSGRVAVDPSRMRRWEIRASSAEVSSALQVDGGSQAAIESRTALWPPTAAAFVQILDPGDGSHDEVIVMPAAWERLRKEKEREIAALVAEGVLRGSGKGKGLRVNAGSFYDWLGEPPPVHPEWAMEYEVVPDSEAADARARRWSRERAREAYRRGPTAPVVHLPDLDIDFGEPSEIDKVVELHKETLREEIEEQWRQLRATDLVLGEVAEDFDGEDPAMPDVRLVLDQTTEKLRELHEDAQGYTGPFELAEPSEEEVTSMRGIVEKAGE